MKRFLIGAVVLIAAGGLLPARRVSAEDDWEWWVYAPVSCRVTPAVKADVTGMFRWKNDMKDFYYRSCLVGGYCTLTSWLDLGGHYWFKETRKTNRDDWVETSTFLVRANFKYKAADWCVLKEANRLEYDTRIDRWQLRLKPAVEFPLVWLGLPGIKLFADNEFFFAFDYQDDRDTFSENRVSVGVDADVVGPFGITVAYRNVGKKSASTGDWDYADILVTYAKLAF